MPEQSWCLVQVLGVDAKLNPPDIAEKKLIPVNLDPTTKQLLFRGVLWPAELQLGHRELPVLPRAEHRDSLQLCSGLCLLCHINPAQHRDSRATPRLPGQ